MGVGGVEALAIGYLLDDGAVGEEGEGFVGREAEGGVVAEAFVEG